MQDKELVCLAVKAAENSYSPYSSYKVGAALLSKSGRVYLGCNIENAAYGETICAERTAFLKAVSEGEREFVKIAVVGSKTDDFSFPAAPCGSCRQVMAEFCSSDFEIILKDGEEIKKYTLSEILPLSFTNKSIN